MGISCVALQDKVYVIGGKKIVGGVSYYESVEVYDPATNAVQPCCDLPEPRIFSGATAYNGKIYLVGGVYSTNEAIETIWIYDPATDT